MPSLKLSCLTLVTTMAMQAAFIQVSAASDTATAAPDQARILSDLENHSPLVDTSALGAGLVGTESADSAAIRSVVRNGDVLEFRVTSVYYADSNDAPQREVDSIVSYRMDGPDWSLLDVQTERTRNVTPGNPGKNGENC